MEAEAQQANGGQVTVVDEPDVGQGPIVVEEIDRLKAENLNLKMFNLTSRETILQQQIADLQSRQLPALRSERDALNEKMMELRKGLEEKYGISLQTHQIRAEDGVVIPRAGQQTASSLLQKLQQVPR